MQIFNLRILHCSLLSPLDPIEFLDLLYPIPQPYRPNSNKQHQLLQLNPLYLQLPLPLRILRHVQCRVVHRVGVGEVGCAVAVLAAVAVIGEVEGVHGLDRDLVRELLDFGGVRRRGDQLLLLVGVKELATLPEFSQFELLQGESVLGCRVMPGLGEDPSLIES